MEEPLVSVVIPVASDGDSLEPCLRSVLRQEYENKEVLLVCRPDQAPPVPSDARQVRVLKAGRPGLLAHLVNTGLQAAKGDVTVVLMPEALPLGERWLHEIIEPFQDESVGAVISQCNPPDEGNVSISARLLLTVTRPELKSKGGQPEDLQTVSYICDAYRASVLAEVGYLDERSYASPGEAVDLSLKIAAAGYRIVLHPRATVLYRDPPEARSLHAALGKALDYGYSDAVLSKAHNIDWLGSRLYAAALLALLLFPIGAINLPVAWILAALLFLWGWFLPLKLPVLRWEAPVVFLHLAAYVALMLSVRDGWLPAVFDRRHSHPAIVRQWCFLASISASYLLILVQVGVRTSIRSAGRGKSVGGAAALLFLGPLWWMLSGLGFLRGYVLGRVSKP